MSTRSKARIFGVDDPGVRERLGMLLMAAGYDVATADNGIHAVSHWSRAIPELIVTDLNMPHMPGVEMISPVRSRHPSVAMNGNYQGDAVAAGIIADRFYLKGQPFQHLVTTIASLIATNPGRESAQENRIRPALDS